MTDDSRIVLIEWIDGGRPAPGWQPLSDINQPHAHRCVSVGFLVQDDLRTKVIAPNLASASGDGDWDQASGLIRIPTLSITKMEYLTAFSFGGVEQRPPLANAEWLRKLA